MMEQIKFTQEEINSINELKNNIQLIFTQLGQVSVERKRVNDELNALETQFLEQHTQLLNAEQDLFSNLNEKYGDGNYDLSTGIFTPTEIKVNQ